MLGDLFWPRAARRALAALLSPLDLGAAASALALDRRLHRPLRALGYSISSGSNPDFHSGQPRYPLLCATASTSDLLPTLREYAERVEGGGIVVLRSDARERERVSAAFLHAGLADIKQVRLGRGFLTAGTVPNYDQSRG